MGKYAANTSFLLRVWQVPGEEGQGFRVSLENIRTGEKLGFASLENFASYLKQVMAQENDKSNGVNHGVHGREGSPASQSW